MSPLAGQQIVLKAFGNICFLNGALSPDGSETTVITDATGAAQVMLLAIAPGPAQVQADAIAVNALAALNFNVQGPLN